MFKSILLNPNIKTNKRLTENFDFILDKLNPASIQFVIMDTFNESFISNENYPNNNFKYKIKSNKANEILKKKVSLKNYAGLKRLFKYSNDKLIFYLEYFNAGDLEYQGFVIIHFNEGQLTDKIEEKIRNRELEFRCVIKEIRKLSEIIFMKSENYSKLYSLLDLFDDFMTFKDKRTLIHSNNVANWSLELGKHFNLSELEIVELYFASFLHDVGKLKIPTEILTKPSKLTNEEYLIMKKHPEISEKVIKSIIKGIPTLKNIPTIASQHHERIDGLGYPKGLTGNDISFLSKIISISDSVDAIISKRSYASEESRDVAIKELIKNSGTQFDSKLVNKMIEILNNDDMKNRKTFLFDSNSIINKKGLLSLKNKYTQEIIHIEGTMKINGHILVEIVNQEDIELKKYDIINFIFVEDDDIFTFDLEVIDFNQNILSVKQISQIPNDKYLSLKWNAPIKIGGYERETYRIGISNLYIKTDINDVNFLKHLKDRKQENIFSSVILTYGDNEDQLKLIMNIKEIIEINNDVYISLKYSYLSDSCRNKISRYLFKKIREA